MESNGYGNPITKSDAGDIYHRPIPPVLGLPQHTQGLQHRKPWTPPGDDGWIRQRPSYVQIIGSIL